MSHGYQQNGSRMKDVVCLRGGCKLWRKRSLVKRYGERESATAITDVRGRAVMNSGNEFKLTHRLHTAISF